LFRTTPFQVDDDDKSLYYVSVYFTFALAEFIHISMYLLAKCQHNENNNTTDNAKWSSEQ